MNFKYLFIAIFAFLVILSTTNNQVGVLANVEFDKSECIKKCLKDNGCSDDDGKKRDAGDCIKHVFTCTKDCTIRK